ncbi:AraC family transcriptional regulator [Clostridium bowmanii]|uniref:AraC family transcriptional regulator n=1 Tax=Clostridium bowmanii TaxID=132925 RepID=UPI001C0BE833|nr:AraC family transcriptional regulator [Clostridium bowmanii]MBU3190042.1 AraC family transcriptional regulator [Clostridium bowmanii]MCA1074521.1 AraC family transcriptional regulator [Clostridium bowmanii]
MDNELIEMPIPDVPINVKIASNKKIHLSSTTHFHKEIELLSVTHGKMSFSMDNKTIIASQGDIIFINSLVPHSTDVLDENTDILIIQFDPKSLCNHQFLLEYKYLSDFLNQSPKLYELFFQGSPLLAELSAILNKIKSEFDQGNSAFQLYIKAYVYMLLACLYRHKVLIEPKNSTEYNLLDKISLALNYIENNFKEEISLEKLCEMVGFNIYYFCRIFKRATNRTFVEYLNFVRIAEAEKLLMFSTKSITDIALEVGFSSSSYFNKTFNKYKGCNPTIYRKYQFLS